MLAAPPQPVTDQQQSPFATTLTLLATLTREHFLFYRLEVGRVVLDAFFSGDAAAYHDKNSNKSAKLTEFLKLHADDLDLLGLNDRLLRQCVQLRAVFLTLPAATREALGYSRMLALTSVDDATKRAQIAKAAVDHRWTVAQVKGTIQNDRAGLWYDTDRDAAGVQAPNPKAVVTLEKPVLAGHLVNRAKRWGETAAEIASDWSKVNMAKTSPAQRKILRDALAQAQAEIAGLLAKLDAEGVAPQSK